MHLCARVYHAGWSTTGQAFTTLHKLIFKTPEAVHINAVSSSVLSSLSRLRDGSAALLLLSALLAPSAQATDTLIPLALPQTGAYGLFGQQFAAGIAQSPLGQTSTFPTADTACSTEGGDEAARQLTALAMTTSFIIGFPCVEALDAAQATGTMEGKTVIVPLATKTGNAPATNTTRHGRQIHIAPTPEQEALALADYVERNWSQVAIALVDDGTLEGRGFIDLMRSELTERRIEPVYVTNYRPQLTNQVALVRLLERAGATHVILGGDRFDATVIAEGAEIVGHRFTLAGNSALAPGSADGALPAGTVYAALPDLTAFDTAADAVADLDEAGVPAEGFVLWGYATGELVSQWLATDNPEAQPIDGVSWPSALGDIVFEGGQLQTNLYRVHRVEADGAVTVQPRATDG